MIRIDGVMPLFVAVIVSALVGCGDGGPPTGDLSGKVYFEDTLVDDCLISLYAPATKVSIGAKVDQEGAFFVKDVPVGEYEIAVRQKTSLSPKEPPFDKRIPKKYRSSDTSELSIKIVEGANEQDLKMSN